MKAYLPLPIVLSLLSSSVDAAPTNEQLYQMIVDMKDEQERLKQEVNQGKSREADLQLELDNTRMELLIADKQIKDVPPSETKQPAIKEGFFASAGLMYVKPKTIFGSSYPIYSSSIATNLNQNDNSNYIPAYQFSAGYQAKNNWDYTFKYKHFDSEQKVNFGYNYYNGINIGILFPDYKINFNKLDFEIGKLVVFDDHLSLKVSGGVRYVSATDNLYSSNSYTYNGGGSGWSSNGGNFSYTTTTVSNTSTSDKTNSWALGPRLNLNPIWKPFGNNFKLFANFGASFLHGNTTSKRFESNSSSCTSSSLIYTCTGSESSYAFSYKQDIMNAIIETVGGIGYALKTDLTEIDLSAGYMLEHGYRLGLFTGFEGAYSSVGIKF
jgi:hypothetical protein